MTLTKGDLIVKERSIPDLLLRQRKLYLSQTSILYTYTNEQRKERKNNEINRFYNLYMFRRNCRLKNFQRYKSSKTKRKKSKNEKKKLKRKVPLTFTN